MPPKQPLIVARELFCDLVKIGVAGEGPQILGIGPQGVMSNAALIAAGIDEGSLVEAGHAELLCWGSASSTQTVQRSEIDP